MPNYYLKFLGGAVQGSLADRARAEQPRHDARGVTNCVEVFPFAGEIVGGLLEFLGAPALPEQEDGSAFMKKLFGSGDPSSRACATW